MTWAWRRFASAIKRHLIVVVAFALIATVGLAFGLTMLGFRTSQDTMVSARSQVYRDDLRYQSLFGGEVMVVIYHGDIRQLFGLGDRDALGRLSAQLGARRDLQSVITPLDAVTFAAAQLRRWPWRP